MAPKMKVERSHAITIDVLRGRFIREKRNHMIARNGRIVNISSPNSCGAVERKEEDLLRQGLIAKGGVACVGSHGEKQTR